MDTESQHDDGHDHFGQSPWMELNSFPPQHQPQGLPEYHGLGYGSSPPMSMESSFGITVPPPYASLPLTMPSHTWPSMLAAHTPFLETNTEPTPTPAPASSPPSTRIPSPRRKSSGAAPNPRRTLTDEDRRRMCIYHEENKSAKQTDIGALFGVERSTVSKVLRQKEKYLNPNDGSRSPIRRSKGRVPDLEKALSNWARNYQRQGFSVNDEMIREKAHFFASTCGCTEGKTITLSSSWLARFKYKNGLGSKYRKSSFDRRSDSDESPTRLNLNSMIESAIGSPNGVSPTVSPVGFETPSPQSPTQSQENIKQEFTDSLAELEGGYHHSHSKSTTSLDTSSSLSAGVTSPTSTMLSESPFTPISQPQIPATDADSKRPRRQTFPFTAIDPSSITAEDSYDTTSSQTIQQPLSVLASPLEEPSRPKVTTTTTDAANIIKRNRSNPEIRTKPMHPPAFSKSNTVSPVSPPGSPTQDEARHALELVMSYFQRQPTGLGAQDYVTIGKLMERLELANAQSNILPGGLTRIDELDDAPRVSKKRIIHNLG